MVHETLIQHGLEVMHSPMIHDAVSFVHVGPVRALREAGHSMAHWLNDHLSLGGPSDSSPSNAAPAIKEVANAAPDSEASGRMVEFFAQSCPHCQHLEPVWKEASGQWAKAHPQDDLKWEQKECYGANWAEGKDHDECLKEGIHSFPTVRFFSKSGKQFADFTDDRTPEKLMRFAAEQGAAAGVAATPGSAPVKVVEYLAKSCPHCQSLEPIWRDLQAASKDIIWEQKECFGDGWAAGKDLEECQKSDIQGFPTIRVFRNGHSEDYHGQRSVAAIQRWLGQLPPEMKTLEALAPVPPPLVPLPLNKVNFL